jgi:hypothetical protein
LNVKKSLLCRLFLFQDAATKALCLSYSGNPSSFLNKKIVKKFEKSIKILNLPAIALGKTLIYN